MIRPASSEQLINVGGGRFGDNKDLCKCVCLCLCGRNRENRDSICVPVCVLGRRPEKEAAERSQHRDRAKQTNKQTHRSPEWEAVKAEREPSDMGNNSSILPGV